MTGFQSELSDRILSRCGPFLWRFQSVINCVPQELSDLGFEPFKDVTVDLRIVLPKSVRNGATAADHAYQEGPRLASLRGITMAKRKKVATYSPADLGVDLGAGESQLGVNPPPARAAGQMVGSVEELVEKLATEAKVL